MDLHAVITRGCAKHLESLFGADLERKAQDALRLLDDDP
jgi:hypothetical protein